MRSFFMQKNLKIGLRQGSKFGTERTRELLARIGNPDNKLKIIHVAGSNGKGSVCAYITAILCAAGKTVGTFTSPAVYSEEECFSIGGRPAPRAKISSALNATKKCAEGMADSPSQFELEVCAAVALFAGEGCEYCVLECGLGGLYDATNAVSQKAVAIITSVGLEHTDVLGGTIIDICRHKGGIINNCPAVVPANLPAEAASYFSSLGAVVAGRDIKITRRSLRGQHFRCGKMRCFIRMHGDEQAYNAALAIKCAGMLGIGRAAIRRGLKHTALPGRVEVIERGGRRYILDGGHNPQALGPLIQTLGRIRGQKSLVYSCLSDKDVHGCAAALGNAFGGVYIVPAPDGRAMDVKKITEAFAPYCKNIYSCGDIPSAMAQAPDKTVVVCGSFTLLKEAKNWIEQRL